MAIGDNSPLKYHAKFGWLLDVQSEERKGRNIDEPDRPIVGEHERFLSLLMGNIPARVWVTDARGRYVFVNSRLCSELKIEHEKWIGFSDEDMFPSVGHVYRRKDLQVLYSGDSLLSTDHAEARRSVKNTRVPVRTVDAHSTSQALFTCFFGADLRAQRLL